MKCRESEFEGEKTFSHWTLSKSEFYDLMITFFSEENVVTVRKNSRKN